MNRATDLTGRTLRLVASVAALALLLLAPSVARAEDALEVRTVGLPDEALPFSISAVWQNNDEPQNIEVTENGNILFPEEDWGNLEYAEVFGRRVFRGDRVEVEHPEIAGLIIIIEIWNYGDRVYIDITVFARLD